MYRDEICVCVWVGECWYACVRIAGCEGEGYCNGWVGGVGMCVRLRVWCVCACARGRVCVRVCVFKREGVHTIIVGAPSQIHQDSRLKKRSRT